MDSKGLASEVRGRTLRGQSSPSNWYSGTMANWVRDFMSPEGTRWIEVAVAQPSPDTSIARARS